MHSNGVLVSRLILLLGKSWKIRAFILLVALQVLFQHAARHSPLRFGDLIASIQSNLTNDSNVNDIDMSG